MNKQILRAVFALTLPLVLGACAVATHDHGSGDKKMGDMHQGMMAKMGAATLSPLAIGPQVSGLVVFHQMDGHLMAHVKLRGLEPMSVHGFHVHEKSSCASADFTSAGGHFNPDGKPHGEQSGERHAGDMPNLTADAQGLVDQKIMLHGVTLAAGERSIDGRTVIVHAAADDYKTQPTGNSGPRIACGLIARHG
ncbi:superoxide dismutase family protein [Paucibacter sp. AS339]|uniref:superoxide dismutase family protein n=1 Tax=Paucibacter hankyongi TaxID=3133434 RepID=UPI00309EE893